MTIPTQLNGYPVIGILPRSGNDGSYVVLVHKEGHQPHPYVTAVWSQTLGTQWVWGHYFERLNNAQDDLIKRAG